MIAITNARPLVALPLAALMLVAGCSQPPATTANGNGASLGGGASNAAMSADTAATPVPAATPTPAAPDQSAYLGRWIGVEGMYLNVTTKPEGGVSLDMQYDLDHHGTYDGSVTAEGLRFIRNGVAETAVHTDGDATGLKWLAGKTDCLTVKQGEGYCRA